MKQTLNDNIEATPQASLKDVSVDELLDDTIGLSFKSVRSIWLLFKDPAVYFGAARAPFWHNRFSPSFRIYAGLIALSTSMRFIWRDENSPMVKLYAGVFEQVKEKPPKGLDPAIIDPTAMAVTTLKWYILIMPFIMVIGYIVLGLIYWGYGEKVNPIVRIRNIFAMMIPASVVGFLTIIPLVLFPSLLTGPMSFLNLVLMFAVVWTTAYRGAFPAAATKGGRAGRATAITALNFIFTILVTMIALIAGIVMAMKEAVAAGAPA